MTSQEIFKQINPQLMKQQEDQKRLVDAKTGFSKQLVVGMAIASKQGGPQAGQTQGGQAQAQPLTQNNGWGSTNA